MSTQIKYKDRVVVAFESGTAILHTDGEQLEGDLEIMSTGGGGECSGNHIIEVDELPTENIDENAFYKMGDSYYKYAKELKDVFQDGFSFTSLIADGINGSLYYVTAKEEVGNPIITDSSNGIIALYYDDTAKDVFTYTGTEGTYTWNALGATTVTNENDIGGEGVYALIGGGLKKWFPVSGVLKITKNGTYDVKNTISVNVDVPSQAVVGVWRFNETLNLHPIEWDSQRINFRSSKFAKYFEAMQTYETVTSNGTVYQLGYNVGYNTSVPYSSDTGWSQGVDEIDFGSEPQIVTSAFKEWLVANANQIESDSDNDNTLFNSVIDGSVTEITAEDLAGVTKMRPYAFAGANLSKGITLPDSITAISNQAFMYTSLPYINIGDAVKTIGSSAFTGCVSLTEVSIGSGVTSIGAACFSNCTSLKKVTCNAVTPPTLDKNVFNNVPSDCMIYVLEESVNAYRAETNWSLRASNIVPIGYVAPEMVTISVKTTETTIFPDGVYETQQAPKGMTIFEFANSIYVPKNTLDEPFYVCTDADSEVKGDYGSASLYTDSTFTTPVTGSFPLNGDVEIWIKW